MPDTTPSASPPTMKPETVLQRIAGSAKFVTVMTGLLITATTALVSRYGLDLSTAQVKDICEWIMALFMVLVGAQAVTGAGKEKAIEERKTAIVTQSISLGVAAADAVEIARTSSLPNLRPVAPSSSSTITKVGLVFLAAVALAGVTFAASGCGGKAGILSRAAAGDLYDCMKPEAVRVLNEVGPVFDRAIRSTINNDGTFDRTPLKQIAASVKEPALRCAFQTAIASAGRVIASMAGAPQSEAQHVDTADARAAFDEMRTEFFGGAQFKIDGEVR